MSSGPSGGPEKIHKRSVHKNEKERRLTYKDGIKDEASEVQGKDGGEKKWKRGIPLHNIRMRIIVRDPQKDIDRLQPVKELKNFGLEKCLRGRGGELLGNGK